MKKYVAIATLVLSGGSAMAQSTPAGLWKTIDDDSKIEKSYVRIIEAGGVVSGRIDKLLEPGTVGAKCDQCEDDRKDKPIQGMTILRNLKHSSDERDVWDNGDVLDPFNGKVYRARVKVLDGGKQLQVRGYLGPFFRTQVWYRIE